MSAGRISNGWSLAAPGIFLVMGAAATYVLAILAAFIPNPQAAWVDPVGALKGEHVGWLQLAIALFIAPVPTANHTLQIVEVFGRRPNWSRWPLIATCALLPVGMLAIAWFRFDHQLWPMITAGVATLTLWMTAAGIPREIARD